MTTISISPRFTDYKHRADFVQALVADKDFTVNDMSSQWDGKACNLTDLRAAGITTVRARYDRLTKQTSIDISKNIA